MQIIRQLSSGELDVSSLLGTGHVKADRLSHAALWQNLCFCMAVYVKSRLVGRQLQGPLKAHIRGAILGGVAPSNVSSACCKHQWTRSRKRYCYPLNTIYVATGTALQS